MAFFLFILGLTFGSFFNVLIERIPNKISITGRSKCDFCNKTLRWYDLLPVFSFIVLKGKCRYCKKKLSFSYPFIEFLTGVLFLSVYLFSPDQGILDLFVGLLVISVLVLVFFIDLRYGIIPNNIVIPSSLGIFIWLLFFHKELLIVNSLSALGLAGFFLLIFLISKGRAMGFGDIKLAIFLGLFFGFPGTLVLAYVAFLTGGLVGTILIIWKKKKLSSQIPFGPFLVLGSLAYFFLQNQIFSVLRLLNLL